MSQKSYKYPTLHKYLKRLTVPSDRKFVGRENIIRQAIATLNRNELSNVLFIAEPGVGKTTVVYMMTAADPTPDRIYYEVRLSLMSASEGGGDGSVEMASRMTKLIDEVIECQKATNKQFVLFMDEIHQILKLSPAAMEAIKPVLANSGANGIKIISATTFEEYSKFIRPNEALDQRFERITVPELSFEQTFNALTNYCKNYLPNETVNPEVLRRIINVTNRALPSQAQPRKSIKVLDAMTGEHTTWHKPMDEKLLNQVMKSSVGINVDYQADVGKAEKYMTQRVFDQELAIRALIDRIYVSVADLNDPTRPRGSFLFTGPTGVGKTELSKALSNVLFGDDNAMIRFDMSEYSRPESVDRLKDGLAEAIWEHPSSIILLDEIEKAAAPCSKLMLQVLDDARLTDRNGRECSFKDAFIIFTTNAGAEVYQEMQEKYGQSSNNYKSDKERQHAQRKLLREFFNLVMRALMSKASQFPPELLGRIDQIVPFGPIDEAGRYKICDLQLKKLSNQVKKKHGVTLHIDRRVREFIVKEHAGSNDTTSGGGREIRRRIDTNLIAKISEVLVKYQTAVTDLSVAIQGNMAIENKFDNEGNAEVVVGAWSN